MQHNDWNTFWFLYNADNAFWFQYNSDNAFGFHYSSDEYYAHYKQCMTIGEISSNNKPLYGLVPQGRVLCDALGIPKTMTMTMLMTMTY